VAFGRKKDEKSEEPAGRFVVDHVPVVISGKSLLQVALNKGAAKGYVLRNIVHSDKHDWILVVWERPGA
jgi:hypothetical protein